MIRLGTSYTQPARTVINIMNITQPIRLLITDFWHPNTVDAMRQNPLYALLSRHFNFELTLQKPDFVIYSCFGNNFRNYDCIRIFYAGENVRPNFHECDYAFSFDYPESERNFRLPLYRLYEEYPQLLLPRDPDHALKNPRRFCAFLNSNPKASERIAFFDQLSGYRPVDGGGKVRNTLGYCVDDKLAFLQQYKFSIAFENSMHPGYTTEKLMQALVAQTIPIYWGNPLAHLDFNPKAYINCHDFGSFAEVIDVVKTIDQDDQLYRQYLSEPYFTDGIENQYTREDKIIAHFTRLFTSRQPMIPASAKRRAKVSGMPLTNAKQRVQRTARRIASWFG